MDLSKTLIRNFVKEINTPPKQKNDNTQLQGTVAIVDDNIFVELDGSQGNLTPVSETVGVSNGDRVLVTIKNRKASIIGNFTDPSSEQSKSVVEVVVYYALSDSETVPPTEGWSEVAPEHVEGKYMWQKTQTTYGNGSTYTSAPTNIQGADGKGGEPGPPGIGIISTTRYYKLSDTVPTKPVTNPPTGGWTSIEPEYTPGDTRNLYLTDQFIWSNNTFSYSDVSKSSSFEAAKQAFDAAQGAMTAANGKNKVYHQTSQPTGGVYKTGDIWFDTDAGNKIYIYNETNGTWEASLIGNDAIVASGIDAGKITAGTLNANVIAANSLTIGKIATEDKEKILNSNVQVGGRNWLQKTGDLSQWYHNTTYVTDDDFNGSEVNLGHGTALSWSYAISSAKANMVFPYADVKDKQFTISFEAKVDVVGSGTSEYLHYAVNAQATAGGSRTKYKGWSIYNNSTSADHLDTEYKKFSRTLTINDALFTSGSGDVNFVCFIFYNYSLANISVRNIKLELGNKATDWTPAPEDVQQYTDDKVDNLNSSVFNQLTETTQTAYSLDVESGATLVTVNKYGGKSLVFNQRVKDAIFATGNTSWVATSTKFSWNVSDGVATVTCTEDTTASYQLAITQRKGQVSELPVCDGHKMFVSADVKANKARLIRLWLRTDADTLKPGNAITKQVSANTFKKLEGIITCDSSTGKGYIHCDVGTNSVIGDTLSMKNAIFIDLTQMFGAGNEPTTVEEVKALLPNDYYEYNTGEVIHADVDKVVVKDADDVATEYLIPQAIRNLEGYGLSARGHSSIKYNEVDFERKKFIKRISIVDMGNYSWAKQASPYCWYCTQIPDLKLDGFILCSKYQNNWAGISSMPNKTIKTGASASQVLIVDHDYENATTAEFKSAMRGVMLCYELATPVETDISETLEALSLEDGSTITFHNSNGDDYRIPVESKLMWYDSSLESRAKADSENASKTATNYIVADSSGLHVTDNTNNVGTSNENSVRIDSDSVDIIKGGETVAEYSQGLTIWSDNGKEIAHLGYGTTQGESGTGPGPYYNLGRRSSGGTKGAYSVAEGALTIASGYYSHAEGGGTVARGGESHAEGRGTVADGDVQHVQGKYNARDNNGTYADIVGNGTGSNNRSNAYALDWNGNGYFAGDVYVGCNADSSGGTNIKDLIKVKTYTISSRSWASGGTWLTNAGISPTADTGYKIIGIVGAIASNQSALIPNLVYNATAWEIRGYVRNVTSSSLTDSIVVRLLEILE